ncbi:MAG: hypothetical protein ACLUD0_05840 [Eubacterium ramulus]
MLNSLIKAPADMIKVLDATVATIRYADVSSWDDWGVIVNGAYDNGTNNTAYAAAGGLQEAFPEQCLERERY